jgi:hypothetical protein
LHEFFELNVEPDQPDGKSVECFDHQSLIGAGIVKETVLPLRIAVPAYSNIDEEADRMGGLCKVLKYLLYYRANIGWDMPPIRPYFGGKLNRP